MWLWSVSDCREGRSFAGSGQILGISRIIPIDPGPESRGRCALVIRGSVVTGMIPGVIVIVAAAAVSCTSGYEDTDARQGQ